jgi:hypothetical protein
MLSRKIHLSSPSDSSAGIVILTNWHVVYGAATMVVIPAGRRHSKTQCVRSDRRTDLTVVTIDASALTSALLGSTSKVVVGDWFLGGRCSGRIGPDGHRRHCRCPGPQHKRRRSCLFRGSPLFEISDGTLKVHELPDLR